MANEINVKEAKVFIDEGSIILDVRTKEEYDGGYIKGSTNVDVRDPLFKEKISKLDKEKNYIVYCASGVRSLNAVKIMSSLNFNSVHSLSGGVIGWKKEGMEVEV